MYVQQEHNTLCLYSSQYTQIENETRTNQPTYLLLAITQHFVDLFKAHCKHSRYVLGCQQRIMQINAAALLNAACCYGQTRY